MFGIMWGVVGIDLSLFTALILWSCTAAAPALDNVSISCDSYGVVVDWKSSAFRPDAEFLLELSGNNEGIIATINTTSRTYNVTGYLENASFNFYVVTVRDTEGHNNTVVAKSQKFTYNPLSTSFIPETIVCKLEFPTVELLPQAGQLSVSFINPFYLYRHTPALRALDEQNVEYKINNQTEICTSFKCESRVSFLEEQEEYCVTLSGSISQIPIKKTEPICHRGSLNPASGLPVALVTIPVLCIVLLVAVGMMCLAKIVDGKIMKKNLSKLPPSLVNKPTHTPCVTLLKIEKDHVINNLQVEPEKKFPNCDLPENTTLLEIQANEDNFSNFLSEEKPGEEFKNNEQKDKVDQEGSDPYGYREDLSYGALSDGYDCPHTQVEMSPGDMVTSYGS